MGKTKKDLDIFNKVLSTLFESLIASASIFVIFSIPTLPCKVFAYDREVILSEVNQTAKDEEVLTDRFKLDLSIGWGYNFAQPMTGSFFDLDAGRQAYLSALNLDYSENHAAVRLIARYALTKKLGIYIAIPFGVVKYKTKSDSLARLFEDDKVNVGIGDIYGGIYYNILSGSRYIPNITLNLDVNSNLAKYWSLGDGLWDFTGSLQIRELLFASFFIYGFGDFTYRLKKNRVEPGAVIGYGGGIGIISSDGTTINEFGIRATKFYKTTLDHMTLMDDIDDLTFVWLSKFGRMGAAITIGNLNKAINIKQNTVGFELSYTFF